MAPFAIPVEFINYRINGAALSNDDRPGLYRRRLNNRWKVLRGASKYISTPVMRPDLQRLKIGPIWITLR